jgi:hypothetical protein
VAYVTRDETETSMAQPSRSPKKKPPTPTPVQRKAAARREEKLELIRQQVKDGSLVIRKMTAAEKSAFAPKAQNKKRAR